MRKRHMSWAAAVLCFALALAAGVRAGDFDPPQGVIAAPIDEDGAAVPIDEAAAALSEGGGPAAIGVGEGQYVGSRVSSADGVDAPSAGGVGESSADGGGLSMDGGDPPHGDAPSGISHDGGNPTDLSEAFSAILRGATREFAAGYCIDSSFLMWLAAEYGEGVVLDLAELSLDGELSPSLWYERTGNSIHVLWTRYCEESGYQRGQLGRVVYKDAADGGVATFGFTGDFNFAEGWITTEHMDAQPGGIRDCVSAGLMDVLEGEDVLVLNNEFAYSAEGASEPLRGKDYTFRADPERAGLLGELGADAVTLANNHTYDYGEAGLLDTMRCLRDEGIPYIGAGKDVGEASEPLYYIVNGRKVAIVAATQIERSVQYTREATETECGVLKTLNPARFVRVIEEAKEQSDYVIAIVHWGTEGNLMPEQSQRVLARQFAQAGADAIIGGHPHRLQGAAFSEGVPVAYSLGNFWFSDGTLYTAVAEVRISSDGSLSLRYVPCLQEGLATRLIEDPGEAGDFYSYVAALSEGVGISADGTVYDKGAEGYPAELIEYDSDAAKTDARGGLDNDGAAIDIVGNRIGG